MLRELYDELNEIVHTHKTNEWKQSWMWNNGGRMGDKYLQNLFLLSLGYESLDYEDVDGLSISISFNTTNGKYRIDIKERYETHNFWIFDKDDFEYVSVYVKDIVTHQFNSITKKYELLKVSNVDYMKAKPNLSKYVRKIKLGKLLN